MILLLLLSPFSRVRLCATPQMAAYQAPPSLGVLPLGGCRFHPWLGNWDSACHTAKEGPHLVHSSVLAWRTPGTGEPGRLPSMGSHRVGHD